MAAENANPTRAYLIQEGIGDPEALAPTRDAVLRALARTEVEDAPDDPILLANAGDTSLVDTIRDAPLARPTSSRAPVVVIQRTNDLPDVGSFVQELPSKAMRLDGVDALVMPKASLGSSTTLKRSEAAERKTLASQARSLGLSTASVGSNVDEGSLRPVDNLLDIKLSASKGLFERSRELAVGLRKATTGHTADSLLEKSVGSKEEESAAMLFPKRRDVSIPDSNPRDRHGEASDLVQQSLQPIASSPGRSPRVGPDMQTFDAWQSARMPTVSPASEGPPSSVGVTVREHLSQSSGFAIDRPLVTRDNRNLPNQPSLGDLASESIGPAHEPTMRGALEHASDADPADVILRETLSGNDCTAMILDVPELSSPGLHTSPSKRGPATPDDAHMIASRYQLRPAADLASLNLNLPDARDMVGTQDAKFAQGRLDDMLAKESLGQPTPQRQTGKFYICGPPADSYNNDDDDEIDELMSDPSEVEEIEFTPPEITQALPSREAEQEQFDLSLKQANQAAIYKQANQAAIHDVNQHKQAAQRDITRETSRAVAPYDSRHSTTIMNTQAMFDNLGDSQLWKSQPEQRTPVVSHNPYKLFASRSGSSGGVERTPITSLRSQNLFLATKQRTQSPSKTLAGTVSKIAHTVAHKESSEPPQAPLQPETPTVCGHAHASLDSLRKSIAVKRRRLAPSIGCTSGRQSLDPHFDVRNRADLKRSNSRASVFKESNMQVDMEAKTGAPQAVTQVSKSVEIAARLAPELGNSLYKPNERVLRELRMLPPLRCHGSFRMLQNAALSRPLLEYQIEVEYSGESARQAKNRNKKSAFTATTKIKEPDLLLGTTSCVLLHKLSNVFQWATVQLSARDSTRMTHAQNIKEALETLSLDYDHITLIFEAFDPPKTAGGVTAPASAAFGPAANKAIETMQAHIRTLRDRIQSHEPDREFGIELCFAGNAYQAAELIRERVDTDLARMTEIQNVSWNDKTRKRLGINQLIADLVCLRISSLDRFAQLSRSERARLFGDLLGPSLNRVNEACARYIDAGWQRLNRIPMRELEEQDPLAAERAHEYDDEMPQEAPLTSFGYVPEAALQASRRELDELQSDGLMDEETEQAMLERQAAEYAEMMRRGYQMTVEHNVHPNAYRAPSYEHADEQQGDYEYEAAFDSPLRARSTHASSSTARPMPQNLQYQQQTPSTSRYMPNRYEGTSASFEQYPGYPFHPSAKRKHVGNEGSSSGKRHKYSAGGIGVSGYGDVF